MCNDVVYMYIYVSRCVISSAVFVCGDFNALFNLLITLNALFF